MRYRFRSSVFRRWLLVALIGCFALTQLLSLHPHHFTDHLAKFGDTHSAQVHGSMLPMSVDHGEEIDMGDDDLSLIKLIAAKLLLLLGFSMVFAVAITVLHHRRIPTTQRVWRLSPHGFIPFLRAPPR